MYEPRIVCFLCKWCTSAGADLAGTSRLQYTPSGVNIRFMCSSRVDPEHVLWAFREGADGVLIGGCHPGDCHYTSGNYHARRKLPAFRELLSFMGVDPRRFKISWVSAAEGSKWAKVVNDITEEARELGPFEKFPSFPKRKPAAAAAGAADG